MEVVKLLMVLFLSFNWHERVGCTQSIVTLCQLTPIAYS